MPRRKESERQRELRPDQLFADQHFHWTVTTAGYRLDRLSHRHADQLDSRPVTGAVLGDMIPLGSDSTSNDRTYVPMERPALFQQFAAIADSAAFVQFANDYGLLGCDSVIFKPAGEKVRLA